MKTKSSIQYILRLAFAAAMALAVLASLFGCAGQPDEDFQDKYNALLESGNDDGLEDTPAETPVTTQPETKPIPTPSLAQQLEGLWFTVEATAQGETEDVSYLGAALEFMADSSIRIYEGFAESGVGAWELTTDGALQLTDMEGDVVTFSNVTMSSDAESFTVDTALDGMPGSMRFVKTGHEAFMAQAADILSAQFKGFWWICGTDEYPPVDSSVLSYGLAIEFKGMKMDFYLGFEVDMLDISFDVVDGGTIHYMKEGDEYTPDIWFQTIDGVQYLAMYSKGETLYFKRSSYDEFMAGASSADDFGSLEMTSWGSDEQFQQAMMNGAWQYAGSEAINREMDVPEYTDITPQGGSILQFGADYILTVIYMDGRDDDAGEYGFGVNHAYVVAGGYDAPEEYYEVNYYYYIDVSGNLVETVRLYSYDRDDYFVVSNANIYTPYEP